jgi:hypothetical protein
MTFGEQLTTAVGVTQYRRLCDAVDYYTSLGYRYIDTPWLVQQKVCNSTKPRQFRPIHHHIDALNHTFHIVASGEQSFLQLQYERHKFGQPLMTGKYQTITPCYRDEQIIDEQHRIGFMKLELIEWVDGNMSAVDAQQSVLRMADDALIFFKQYVLSAKLAPNELNITEFGLDAQSPSGIELGSYGVRRRQIRDFRLHWVYGTGCAEPRLSYAIEKES